jgi:hypothetical protein
VPPQMEAFRRFRFLNLCCERSASRQRRRLIVETEALAATLAVDRPQRHPSVTSWATGRRNVRGDRVAQAISAGAAFCGARVVQDTAARAERRAAGGDGLLAATKAKSGIVRQGRTAAGTPHLSLSPQPIRNWSKRRQAYTTGTAGRRQIQIRGRATGRVCCLLAEAVGRRRHARMAQSRAHARPRPGQHRSRESIDIILGLRGGRQPYRPPRPNLPRRQAPVDDEDAAGGVAGVG